jgi:hypothetical protein
MMRKLAGCTLLSIVLALGIAGAALAHHSHAMFDTAKEVTVKGTVTSISFRNPHVFLYVDVLGDDGKLVTWAVEMSNLSNMISRGIKNSTFKPGDVVTVTVNPLKTGKPGGNYTSVIAADGKRYD